MPVITITYGLQLQDTGQLDSPINKIKQLKIRLIDKFDTRLVTLSTFFYESDMNFAQLNPAQLRWSLLSSSDHPPTHISRKSAWESPEGEPRRAQPFSLML